MVFRFGFRGWVSRSGFVVRFLGRVLRSVFIVGDQVSRLGFMVRFCGWVKGLGFAAGFWGRVL